MYPYRKSQIFFVGFLVSLTLISCNARAIDTPKYLMSKTVLVARPHQSEIDKLPTLSKLKLCNGQDGQKQCDISHFQAIKWGWGYCWSNNRQRELGLVNAYVRLYVNDMLLPSDVIYQRDEDYDRENAAFCHTWFVKLSEWKSGSVVTLMNKANLQNGFGDRNLFLINVQ